MSRSKLSDFNAGESYQHLGSKCFHSTPLTNIKWKVHPMVIFTILDSYMRREDGQYNVIGTLLGVVCEANTVEITDSFVDRHSLTDEGLLQIIKDHHENMYELKQKINPKEQVVGWFCTGSEMTELTCAVHGWFKQFNSVSKFYPNPNLYEPIHLLVDASCDSASMMIKAYVQLPLTITKDACFQFHEVDLELLVSPSDTAGISYLLKSLDNSKSRNPHNSDTLLPNTFENSLLKLKDLIDKCIKLVENAMEKGNSKIYPEVGRFLLKTVSTEKLMNLKKIEKICELSLQDNLMVTVKNHIWCRSPTWQTWQTYNSRSLST
uniref:JAB1/Mov34/MPN/PAD-1 ubiquitin protease, putative n=1 Tax=Theileria annulata TaxID=5874 RepID=A0A3B0MZZ1_THEAN